MPRKLDLGKTLGNTGVFASSTVYRNLKVQIFTSLTKDNYLKFQGKTLGHKMLLGQCSALKHCTQQEDVGGGRGGRQHYSFPNETIGILLQLILFNCFYNVAVQINSVDILYVTANIS